MKNTKRTILKTLTPMLALGLALSACGGSDSQASQADSASSQHNEQDVTFATEMIPHHAQAVRMSEMAVQNTESQDVLDLAADISAAQDPEIEQMSGWLEAWGEPVPDTDMGGMGGMGGMDGMDMAGMMSPEEMDSLDAATGAAFDKMFLTSMIEHHEGAIDMAQTQRAEGENAEAVELAETIEETQTAEIKTIRELLASR